MKILDWIGSRIEWIVLLAPSACVVWEALFLRLAGGQRHFRRLGLSLYLGAFGLGIGTFLTTKQLASDRQVAFFLIMCLLGGGLPLVALLIAEDSRGQLRIASGPTWARIVGVFVYSTVAFLLASIQHP